MRVFIYLILLSTVYCRVSGQMLPINGDLGYGSTGKEFLVKSIQTSDGGYLITGQTSTADTDVKGPAQGNVDYWAVKTAANGALQWSKLIGSTTNDYVSDAVEDKIHGGYVLIGYTEATSASASGHLLNPGKGGYSDIWIVKLTSDGSAIAWEKRFGGNKEDYAVSIVQLATGNFLIAGFTNSSAGSGDLGMDAARGDFDYRLMEISAAGNLLWDRRLGEAGFEGTGANGGLMAAIATSDGGYLIGSRSFSNHSGDKSQNTSGGKSDIWVVKLNASRSIEWNITLGGSNEEKFTSLFELNGGGYVVTGTSTSGTYGSPSNRDYWIAKLNTSGSKDWEYKYGGSKEDELTSAIQTSDGGFLLGGWSTSGNSGSKTQASLGAADYWVVKLFADGTKYWDDTFGGNAGDYLANSIETTDGGILLAGTSGSGASGTKTASGKGNNDFWLIKLAGTIPLPITLVSFQARLLATHAVELSWTTASEENNAYFTVERSTDNLLFEEVSRVAGAIQSKQMRTYRAIDHSPLNGVSYYRIKQSDLDGKYSYSKSVSIQAQNKGLAGYTIYPNPSSGSELFITVDEAMRDENISISIDDLMGNNVLRSNFVYSQSINLLKAQPLKKGIYIVTLATRDSAVRKKVIVE